MHGSMRAFQCAARIPVNEGGSITQHIVVILLCIVFVNCCAGARFPVPAPYVDPDEVAVQHEGDQRPVDFLSKYVDRLARKKNFNGVILFARGQERLLHRAYGWADRESLVPNTTQTRFNLASASKMFTAIAMARLAEDSLVSLEDTISRHLDSGWISPDAGARVRIVHLLNHTSGLGHYWDAYDEYKDSLMALDDFQAIISDSLAFDPGSEWRYSNSGFVLLGAIVERVSGDTYYEFVQGNVFEPCAMRETGFYGNPGRQPGYAVGYFEDENDAGRLKDNVDQLGPRGSPAGGAWSTAGDMHRFLLCVQGSDLLRAETRVAFLTATEIAGDYGYGFQVKESWLGHWGGFPGIEAFVMCFADTDHYLIILSNYFDSALPLIGKLGRIAGMLEP